MRRTYTGNGLPNGLFRNYTLFNDHTVTNGGRDDNNRKEIDDAKTEAGKKRS